MIYNLVPEGDECSPNTCGPNSGCRLVNGRRRCFCLPEFEGNPPTQPCSIPENPCTPSPCGPNTQCSILNNGFAKCTCLPGYLESPNTIRGCIEQRNPCEPNPCGRGAYCDPNRAPVCFCPEYTIGNPYKGCQAPSITPALCQPGPCGINANCYVVNNQEKCYCEPGFIGDGYSGCRSQPVSPCHPNPCGPGASCTVSAQGYPQCQCPDGLLGDPSSPNGCQQVECQTDDDCSDKQACTRYRCRDPCPGACGINANCRVEKHHPVCTCEHSYTGNPILRCFPIPSPLPANDPCWPSPCGINTQCRVMSGRAVCSCLPDFQGDPQLGCQPECVINSDCPLDQVCLDRHCRNPCALGNLCGLNALCSCQYHTVLCSCPDQYMGNPFIQCTPKRKLLNF